MLGAATLPIWLHGCGKPDVIVEETPIRIVEESIGRGAEASDGDLVTISYTVSMTDGRPVLSDNTYTFELGRGTVIAGIDEAVRGMRLGGRRLVECPPHKHWGRAGYGNGKIPPNTVLMMDIMLKSVD